MSPRPFAQRRQVHRDQVQAVEQVLAELPARDEPREVAVGGRDHAHVDSAGTARAEQLEACGLQHPQELDLRGGSGSPISSRKIVPPCASSKRPLRSALASVKAPRT